MKSFIRAIRPAYASQIPNRKSLSGNLLDNAYEKLNKKLACALRDCKYYSIVTDGWSNVRFDHIVNFIIIIDGEKPLFYKSIDTSNVVQSSETIFADICDVIEELGSEKLVSVITDNANCMKKALDLIEEKFPKVFGNGCAAHTMNLLIKDICDSEQNSETMVKGVKVVYYPVTQVRYNNFWP